MSEGFRISGKEKLQLADPPNAVLPEGGSAFQKLQEYKIPKGKG